MFSAQEKTLLEMAKYLRYWVLRSTTKAGSGHPTSCLSAVDLMVGLAVNKNFKFDTQNLNNPNNDQIVFSKGHAAPLLYAWWAMMDAYPANKLDELRQFDSVFEGHPTPRLPLVKVATGSLGQGLGVGVGMALAARYVEHSAAKIYVLLGDGELAEGSTYEAMAAASYHDLPNLIAIADINRLGQTGPTRYDHDLDSYANKAEAFGWEVAMIDGHNYDQILSALALAGKSRNKPLLILAKTLKGKGISFIENESGWHGKALSSEDFLKAQDELFKTTDANFEPAKPNVFLSPAITRRVSAPTKQKLAKKPSLNINSTRQSISWALVEAASENTQVHVLDADVGNSTFTEMFYQQFPERFWQNFIAEQQMVALAMGMAARSLRPVVTTYAAFLTRAFDQIRMTSISKLNILFVGFHAGVSVGKDGPSQMGLEDLAMFRSQPDTIILSPADPISAAKLTPLLLNEPGIKYLRTFRPDVENIYSIDTQFKIGGSQTLFTSENDQITIVSHGVCLHEAIKVYHQAKNIKIRVIDAYSIQPLDLVTLEKAIKETKGMIVVEDHYQAGGLGELIASSLQHHHKPIKILAVNKIAKSGSPEELLDWEGISASAILKEVETMVSNN